MQGRTFLMRVCWLCTMLLIQLRTCSCDVFNPNYHASTLQQLPSVGADSTAAQLSGVSGAAGQHIRQLQSSTAQLARSSRLQEETQSLSAANRRLKSGQRRRLVNFFDDVGDFFKDLGDVRVSSLHAHALSPPLRRPCTHLGTTNDTGFVAHHLCGSCSRHLDTHSIRMRSKSLLLGNVLICLAQHTGPQGRFQRQ